LLESVEGLKGVGPAAAEALKRMGIQTKLDLLFHLPVGVFDWGADKLVRELQDGDTASVSVKIVSHTEAEGRRPLTIHCVDEEGTPLDLIFFLNRRNYGYFYTKKFYPGSVHRLQGKVTQAKYGEKNLCMSHPEAVKEGGGEGGKEGTVVEPLYRLTSGLNANKLRDFIQEALRALPPSLPPPSSTKSTRFNPLSSSFPDWLEDSFREAKGWPTFPEALYQVHNPTRVDDIHASSKARERLAFDELLASQLPTALRRAQDKKGALAAAVDPATAAAVATAARAVSGDGHLTGPCIQQLPFQMTEGQKRTVSEIWGDMASNQGRMIRLLQGDVGSGKTVCALLAMLRAVEGGWQAALLSPTEILAFQHLKTLEELTKGLKVRVGGREGGKERPLRIEVLTSSAKKGKARKVLLEELGRGEIDILVGTHSLLSPEVVFDKLGLAVIDEEHRFGVKQREKLSNDTNVLYMSATPIPRTLLLTNYGDMEVSRLEEAPARDVKVTTTIFALTSVGQIAERLKKKILENSGEKVFWVLPCIEDKEEGGGGGRGWGGGGAEGGGITSVVYRYGALVELLGKERVGMVHGKMDSESKLKALRDFSAGETSVLVSTSVIEVGVDVPDATVCIVEHAEYFGLSQLHQLRGRIGRATSGGSSSSSMRECHCVLTYDDASPNREKALQRLLTLKRTADGFEIAEQDLKLRGPGEVLGNKQSGHDGFRLVDLGKHEELLDEAYTLARAHAAVCVRGEKEGGEEAVVMTWKLKKEGVETLLRFFSTVSDGSGGEEVPVKAVRVTRSSSSSMSVSSSMSASAAASGWISASPPAAVTAAAAAKKKAPAKARSSYASSSSTSTTTSSSSSYLPGWNIITYGDRYEICTPPPSPDDEDELELAEALDATSLSSSELPLLSTRFSTDDQPIPRMEIDLEREDLTFIIFDTETTGLKAESDRIIQLAAKVLTPAAWGGEEEGEGGREAGQAGREAGGEPEDGLIFDRYVDPGFWIPAKITEITGISNESLFRARARKFEEVWPDFVRWVNAVRGGKPVVLVAHNAGFDHKFVMFDLKRGGWDERMFREETHIVGMMDTLPVFRSEELWSKRKGDGLPGKPNNYRQGTLYRYLLGEELQNAHSAKGDVLGLEALLSHPSVCRKWRGVGSASVLEMGGWEGGREGSGGGGGGGGFAAAAAAAGGGGGGGGGAAASASSSRGAGKTLVTRRATEGDGRRAS